MRQLVDCLIIKIVNRNGDHAERPGGKSDLHAVWRPIWMGVNPFGQPTLAGYSQEGKEWYSMAFSER